MTAPQRIQLQRTKGTGCRSGCGRLARQGMRGFCGATCRFWSKVVSGDGCWLWTGGAHNAKGYGRIDADGTRWLVHRYAYSLLKGQIPPGMEVDHLCRNTLCVNPDHLEAVTSEEHDRRSDQGAYNRAKEHCPRGHAYSDDNTRLSGTRRHCRTCERGRAR